VSHDSLQQAIEMIIGGIIKLLERIKASGKVCPKHWGIVVSDGRVIQNESMPVIV